MATEQVLDARGYKRTPANLPGFDAGVPPRNKGRRYPPDPPAVQEIVQLIGGCRDDACGRRLRALIVVLWRSGLRISEALALEERDINPTTGAIVVRCGKGGKRRIVGMDPWGWEQLEPWLAERQDYPIAPHQFRHGHACDWVRENAPVHLLQRQLGHSSLSVTTKYLEAVTNDEVVDVSMQRRPPTMPVPDLMGTLHSSNGGRRA